MTATCAQPTVLPMSAAALLLLLPACDDAPSGPPGPTIELVPDPLQPLLYAALDINDGYYLHVLDPGTLGQLAVVATDVYGGCGGCSVHHAGYLDPDTRRLHLLDYGSFLRSFDLLP